MRKRRVAIESADTLSVPIGITLPELADNLRDALNELGSLLELASTDDAGAFVLRPNGAPGMAGGVHEAACKALNLSGLVLERCANSPGPPQPPAGVRISSGIRPGMRGLSAAISRLEGCIGPWRVRVPDVVPASVLQTLRAAAIAVAWHAEPQRGEAPHYVVPGDKQWGMSWPLDWTEQDWARWMGTAYGWIIEGMHAVGDRFELHTPPERLRAFGERQDIHTHWANSERDPTTDAFIPGRLHQLKIAAASRHVHKALREAGSFWPFVSTEQAAELRAAHADFMRLGGQERGDTRGVPVGEGDGDTLGPAITKNQALVLQTMAMIDATRLLSSKVIVDEMGAAVRLSEETVRQCVGKLIESGLAERPEGDRHGARLTMAGRRLAVKIAD